MGLLEECHEVIPIRCKPLKLALSLSQDPFVVQLLMRNPNTVNVHILACIHFHKFAKIDNFVCIYIRVFGNIASYSLNDKLFSRCTYFRRHFKNVKISRFTVIVFVFVTKAILHKLYDLNTA